MRRLRALVFITVLLVASGSSFGDCGSDYGTSLGSYRNVTAYSQGSCAGTGDGTYQCVEYVKRFYSQAIGLNTSGWHGNGTDYYGSATAKGLTAYPNGGTEAPKPDDILCFSGSTYGHVAIVTGVSATQVQLIEQNWARYSCFSPPNSPVTLTITNGHYTCSNRGSYVVQGWIRKPGVADTTAPSITWGGQPTGRWYNDLGLQVVDWTVSDDKSGVKGFGQAWNADPEYQFASTSGYLTLSYLPSGQQEGQHTAHVHAWDNAGNNSDNTKGWYGCDLTAPEVTITGGPPVGVWQRSSQRISWHVSDNLSGVRGFGQAWDSDPGFQYNATDGWFDMPEGSHTLHVHTWDNTDNARGDAGNHQDRTFGPYLLDTVAPTISNVGGPSTSQWYGTPQTVTWNAADATSGIASSTLQWDTGAVTPVTPEGKHSGTITATDNAGNVKTQAVGPYWVDLTAPAVAVVLNPAQPDGDNGWYKTAPSASVTAGDGVGSGVTGIFYRLDGSDYPYTGAIGISDGTHSLSGRAVDLVGHSGLTLPIPVRVDTAPPVITNLATDAQSYSLSTLVAAWSGNDAASGIAEYRYMVGTAPGADDTKPEASNGASTNAYITGLNLTDGGTYYISVRARDIAGHWCDWISSSAVTVFAGEGREDSPNLNAGGVSVPAEARRSENYMVVDSVAQFAVDVSYSGNYVVQSGYWHPEEGTSFLGAYDSPNFNAGGVSGDVVRISENYRLVDSIAQFAVETSTSEGFIVESGLWHSDRSYTEIDLMRVLAITAGIDEASSDDLAHYDTVGGSSAGKLDIADACAVARKVAGLEANP